jgi:thiamine biosynthesis lipoprotein
VLVSLGGDIAVAGEAPDGGWPVAVADEQQPASRAPYGGRRAVRVPDANRQASQAPAGSRQAGRAPEGSPGQVVRLAAGTLATSSITCRRWRRGGRNLHHIVDPRTGLPADGPWRTVSVAAARCAEANAAATAAIVMGHPAEAWLAEQGLPARLVTRDGRVRLVAGWPAAEGGLVDPPAACRMPPAPRGAR